MILGDIQYKIQIRDKDENILVGLFPLQWQIKLDYKIE